MALSSVRVSRNMDPATLQGQLVTAIQAIQSLLLPFDRPESWKPLPLVTTGGWRPYATVESPQFPQYRKDVLGYVELRGFVEYLSGSSLAPFAVLPLGYRPLSKETFAVASNFLTVPPAEGTGPVEVRTDGTLRWVGAPGAGSRYISVSGVRFRVTA